MDSSHSNSSVCSNSSSRTCDLMVDVMIVVDMVCMVIVACMVIVVLWRL